MLVDNVLGVVEEDRVPREVRDWLTLTFTRTAAANAPKRLADEKLLKFRSVAHAIRAGIVVDRLTLYYYCRCYSLSTVATKVAENGDKL